VPSPGLPNAGAQLPEPIPQPTAARPADRPDSVQPELPKPALQTAAVTPVDRQVVAGPALAEVASQPVVAEAVYRKEPGMSEVASEPPAPKQPQLTAPQANWMAALHPGFRGDAGRLIGVYPSTEPEPARPLADAAPKEPRPGSAVPEPVLKQPVEQPNDRGKSAAKVESPPVVLDGYCPVELNDNERWVPGDPRWTAVHHGGTYLFSGPAQRQRFLENPARYTPANSGCDPVLSVDGQRQVPGQTDYCVTYQGRLYMFSSSVTLARFQKNPDHYCAAR
jgi:YHS domain-containing protein